MDDLKPTLHCWSDGPPDVPPSQVHIIVLERVSLPHNNSSADQHVSNSKSNTAVTPKADSSLHENKLDNAVNQDSENELDTNSSNETQSKDNLVDSNSNRFPFKDLHTPNRTPQVINNERTTTPSSTVNSSTLHRVKLKRLTCGRQFQPFLPKSPKMLLNEFQPYVPKKERSCLTERSCIEGNNESIGAVNSPADSGYSSPSSVGSCSSSVSCEKEECIADQLEKLLPDCLENAAPIKNMSENQDDFIEKLLNS